MVQDGARAPTRWSTLQRLGASTAMGAFGGFAIGGVGGRLAMLLLRITSDPVLHGRSTDDGFTIGIVSTETTFLLIATTVIGALGGAAYLLIRGALPERRRALVTGALGALVGGAVIIRPDGIDFTALDPLALAVALFVAIPFAGAAAISSLAERALRGGRVEAHRRWLLGLAPLILVGGLGPTSALVVALTLAAAGWWPEIRAGGAGGPAALITFGGRLALVAVAGVASVVLVQDVVAVL
jgi:hypothetical protein